ncbi:MAG: hypothetical protein EP343_02645 [Deltaproteobacteria bacterium]|nr:MAG: hypothetical protein EP343_02645 [Deltaproteobacteria bacterium]
MQATKTIIDSLLASGTLKPQELQHAARIQSVQGGDLLQILFRLEYISPRQVEDLQRLTPGPRRGPSQGYSANHREAPTPHFPKGFQGTGHRSNPGLPPRHNPQITPSAGAASTDDMMPPPNPEDLRDDLDIVFDPPTIEFPEGGSPEFSISLMQDGQVPSQADLSQFMKQGSPAPVASQPPSLSSQGLFDTVFEVSPPPDATTHTLRDRAGDPPADATLHVSGEDAPFASPDATQFSVGSSTQGTESPAEESTAQGGHSLFDTAWMEEVPDFAKLGVDVDALMSSGNAEQPGVLEQMQTAPGVVTEASKAPISVVLAPPQKDIPLTHCPACKEELLPTAKVCFACCGYVSNLPEDLELAGTLVHGQFLLSGRMGGGIGYDAYHAMDQKSQSPVQIKLYPYDNRTPETLFLFQRRAEWLRAVQHPSLIQIVEVGVDPEWGGLVVESLVPSVSLRDFLRRQKGFALKDLLPLFDALCGVLQECHSQDVFHCNLSLNSVVFPIPAESWSNVLLVDPSLPPFLPHSRALERAVTSRPESDLALLPELPEQGKPEPGVGGDVYRLGVILFELLTGHPPFFGSFPLVLQLQHTDVPPPTLFQVRPDIPFPEQLQTLLNMSLEKDPEQRVRSVPEWLTLLHNAVSFDSELWVPGQWDAPPATSMDRHIQEAAHDLLRQCHRPIFREPMSHVGVFHHLSVLLRTPNIQSLQSVEEVMDSFVPSQELLAAGSVLSSEGWDAAPDLTLAEPPYVEPILTSDRQMSYQVLPSAAGDFFRRDDILESRRRRKGGEPTIILESGRQGPKRTDVSSASSKASNTSKGWTLKGVLWLFIGLLFLVAAFLFFFK